MIAISAKVDAENRSESKYVQGRGVRRKICMCALSHANSIRNRNVRVARAIPLPLLGYLTFLATRHVHMLPLRLNIVAFLSQKTR